MGELYDIAQRHMDAYGVRAAALARRMDMSPQTLNSWKQRGVRELPSKANLEALARETRTPYGEVLTAALRDIGYLPKERDGRGNAAPTIAAGSAPAEVDMIVSEQSMSVDLEPAETPSPRHGVARQRPGRP